MGMWISLFSSDQTRAADLAATVRTIGLSHWLAIADKVSSFVGRCRSFDRALLTDLSMLHRVIVHRWQASSHREMWWFLDGEFRQPLAGDVEQVVAVLGQQVQGADDVGDVAGVGLFEAQAIQGFEQVAGGADALAGGVEDFEGVGFGVDDQYRGFAVAGFEWAVAVGQWIGERH
ncbi:hypothetical protein D3C86_1171160 [compost metagenome]